MIMKDLNDQLTYLRERICNLNERLAKFVESTDVKWICQDRIRRIKPVRQTEHFWVIQEFKENANNWKDWGTIDDFMAHAIIQRELRKWYNTDENGEETQKKIIYNPKTQTYLEALIGQWELQHKYSKMQIDYEEIQIDMDDKEDPIPF